MDFLIVDRDSLTTQLLASKLESRGHTALIDPNKTTAFERLQTMDFHGIFLDPSPLAEARPVIIGLWKNIVKNRPRPYLLLLGKTVETEQAILAGANDAMIKPLAQDELETKIGNVQRMVDIMRWLATEDRVHSHGGVIGKAAFQQLFLSALDRAFRYAERTLIVFIGLGNHAELLQKLGPEKYEQTLDRLAEQMNYMRRQSDVIGRISSHDFAILLQRPQNNQEPLDALNRFAETLENYCRSLAGTPEAPVLRLTLVEVPQGAQLGERLATAAGGSSDVSPVVG